MRVLINAVDLGVEGGVAGFYQELLPHLADCAEHFVIGRRDFSERPYATGLRMAADYLRFAARLAKGGVDLVHLNPSLGAKAVLRDGVFLALARAMGKRTLVFIHGWDDDYERRLRRNGLALFKAVYFKADAFVVLGTTFSARLREMGYQGPIHVETTLAADSWFERAARPAERPAGPGRILLVTRMEKSKGIYEVLEAFRLLKQRFPDLKLMAAGDGPDFPVFKESVRQSGLSGISLPGYIRGEEKLKAFIEADLFLFPTFYGEGMPVAVLEALAAGIPVITRPVGGIADFFEDGRIGYATESRDPAVFAELTERLLLDAELRRAMSARARELALERFAASGVAARLKEIYRRTIAGPGV